MSRQRRFMGAFGKSFGRSLAGSLIASSLLLAACGPTKVPGEGEASTAAPELLSVRLVNKQNTRLPAKPIADAAAEFVAQTEELTGPLDEWKVRASGVGADGLHHVRMRQYYDGVRVWGGDIVVHANDAQVTMINGGMVKNLESLDTVPTFKGEAAITAAKADYARAANNFVTALAYARESNELVILPSSGHEARLAWHVVFFTELQAGIAPALSNYFIDARTGELIKKWNGIHTLSQASGPGGNAKVARTWTDALDVEPSGTQFVMDTARLRTLNMNSGTSGGTVVTGPLTSIGDAPINDAHGFAEVTLNMLTDWGGYNSINNAGFKIISRVHYGSSYENAFWDGAQMTYGDGATTFYPLSGDVDVVSHEIHHGFTTFHSDLVYSSESGGMNESFSDIMGTAAEFYSEGAGADWDLGRDIFKGNTALRFMCNPTQDGRSIDNLANFVEGIDVHFSSGIMNKAFCRAARRLASGSPTGEATAASVQKLAKAFYLANDDYWTSSSTFVQGCQGTMDATTALSWTAAERDALRTSWTESGVYCDGLVEPLVCDQTFTAASGTLTSPNYPNQYPNNYRRTWCIQPAGGAAATLHFTAFATEAGFDFVEIKNATGIVQSRTAGNTAPADVTSTLIAVKFTSDPSVTGTGFSATWTSTGGTPNNPPTVSITSPANGAQVSGAVAVAATAADDTAVARVKFELPDGTAVDDTTAPYGVSWNSATVADGPTYIIRATAYDNLGVASTVASVTVSVRNSGDWSASGSPNLALVDNGQACTDLTISGAGNAAAAKLNLTGNHTWRAALRGTLAHNGVTVAAFPVNMFASDTGAFSLTNRTVAGFSGSATGQWTLCIVDTDAFGDTGALATWSIHN
jgi:vibriolysin